MRNPFRYFNSSPEVIRLTVMMYVRYPLSLRQVEDLLFERGIDICRGRCQSKILNTWSGHRTAQIDPEKCRKINGREIRF
jgi:transposase-like protein